MSACCGTDDARMPVPLMRRLRGRSRSSGRRQRALFRPRRPRLFHQGACRGAGPAHALVEIRQDLIDTDGAGRRTGPAPAWPRAEGRAGRPALYEPRGRRHGLTRAGLHPRHRGGISAGRPRDRATSLPIRRRSLFEDCEVALGERGHAGIPALADRGRHRASAQPRRGARRAGRLRAHGRRSSPAQHGLAPIAASTHPFAGLDARRRTPTRSATTCWRAISRRCGAAPADLRHACACRASRTRSCAST